jgi:hypothetical protein
VNGERQGLVVGVVGVVDPAAIVVAGERPEEVIRQRVAGPGGFGVLGCETRALQEAVECERLRDVPAGNAEVRNIGEEAVREILLDAECDVVVIRDLVVDFEALGVAGRERR